MVSNQLVYQSTELNKGRRRTGGVSIDKMKVSLSSLFCPSEKVVRKKTGPKKPLKKSSEIPKTEVLYSKARKGKAEVKSTGPQTTKKTSGKKTITYFLTSLC